MTVFEGVLSTKASSLAIGVDQIVNSVLLFINCIIPSNELVLKRYCYLCSLSLHPSLNFSYLRIAAMTT